MTDGACASVRARLVAGAPAGNLTGLSPRVRRAVELAERLGAPAVPALDAAVAAEDDERRRRRAVHAATAQARAVTTALALLPVLALAGLAALLDLPLWRFYLTPPGAGVAGLAGALSVAGLAGTHLLVRTASRPGAGDDEVADLLATALTAGLPAGAALRAVSEALPERRTGLSRAALALELDLPMDLPDAVARLSHLLAESTRWGSPAAPALRHAAASARADDLARALAATERLPALLTFPVTLCLLPASLLAVGAPLVGAGLEAAGVGIRP